MDTPVFLQASEILARIGATAFGSGFIAAADAAAGRSALGLVIGTNVQAYSANLAALSALTVGVAANNLVQLTAASKLPAVDGSLLTNLPTPSGVLLATGATTGATSQTQTFTNGIIGPSWKPASDTTTALQMQNAAGTAIGTWNTTNGFLGIGKTPTVPLDIEKNQSGGIIAKFHRGGSEKALYISAANNAFSYISSEGEISIRTNVTAGSPISTGTETMRWSGAYTYFGGLRVGGSDAANTIYQNAIISITTGGGNQGLRIDNSGNLTVRNSSGTVLARFATAGGLYMGADVAATAQIDAAAGTTAMASLRLRAGVAPTSPNNGDVWFDGTDLKMRIGGVTKTFTLV